MIEQDLTGFQNLLGLYKRKNHGRSKKHKKTFERNVEAIKLRPSMAKSTGKSIITVSNGTTCKIEGSG